MSQDEMNQICKRVLEVVPELTEGHRKKIKKNGVIVLCFSFFGLAIAIAYQALSAGIFIMILPIVMTSVVLADIAILYPYLPAFRKFTIFFALCEDGITFRLQGNNTVSIYDGNGNVIDTFFLKR